MKQLNTQIAACQQKIRNRMLTEMFQNKTERNLQIIIRKRNKLINMK